MKYLLTVLFLSFLSPLASADTSARIEAIIPKLEKFISSGLDQSHVPGAAVAIVSEGKVVYMKGFGYRDLANRLAVTPNTVFQLASVSKPLTTTVLAMLAAQDKLFWDAKIVDLTPSFALSDPWVTAHLTILDLLSHRSGLPDHAGDLQEDLGYLREEILHNLRYIRNLGDFRESYAYTNFGFSQAAYAAAPDWEMTAQKILFKPLGMSRTSYSFLAYEKSPDRALTYKIKAGKALVVDPARNPDAQAPAGGASSTVSDMAKWMLLQLDEGTDEALSKALAKTHVPVIVIGVDSETGRPNFYGLGWNVSFEEGKTFLKHSGAFALGVRSEVALVPEERIGIVFLSNASPTALPEAVTKAFFDLLYKGEVEEGLVKRYNEKWMKYEVEPEVFYQVKEALPSLPLAAYAGSYENRYFGKIEVKEGEGKKQLALVIVPSGKVFAMRHVTRDVFAIRTDGENSVGETQVLFLLDVEGKVRSVTIDYLNEFGEGTFFKNP